MEGMNVPPPITLTAQYLLLDEEPGHGWQLDRDEQFIIYHVWTVGTYKNGHPLFDLRAVTTSLLKAQTYSKMLRRDKEPGDLWYRVHIEARVANHLYGECMRAMDEAIGVMPGSPVIGTRTKRAKP